MREEYHSKFGDPVYVLRKEKSICEYGDESYLSALQNIDDNQN